MSHILVTGAAGFIGSHVVERLLERGDQVVGFDNFDPFYPREVKQANLASALGHPSFTLVEGDLRDPTAVGALFERYHPRRVIHLGAKAGVRPSISDPEAYLQVNVAGTLNVLRAAERYPIDHFVFASSSSVYGDTDRVPFRELDSTDSPASPYAATKKAGEAICFTYHRLLGIPITCLRFFTVYGPRQRPDLAIHKFVRMIEAGEPVPFFGDGTSSRDYTYVSDTVSGVLASLDRPGGYNVYNLGRSDPVSLRDMVTSIEGALGSRAVLKEHPVQAGDVHTTFADITRAKDRLGYDPKVSFNDGIRRFVAWYQSKTPVEAASL